MEISVEDNFDDTDEVKPKRRFRLSPILSGLTPFILIILTIIYIATFQKEAVDDFLKKYDFLGLSQTGQAEKQRLYQINNLPIPFEQRQALVQGTVFLGATKQMVELALGQPSSSPQQMADGTEKWVYFFQDSSRPTYLFFEKDKLANAAKGTTLDNAEIQ
jgi:hypothetical protein